MRGALALSIGHVTVKVTTRHSVDVKNAAGISHTIFKRDQDGDELECHQQMHGIHSCDIN